MSPGFNYSLFRRALKALSLDIFDLPVFFNPFLVVSSGEQSRSDGLTG